MKLASFKQSVTLNASTSEVYDALMDSKKHGSFTGGTAKISKKVGGEFSVFDGYVSGKNVELVPGKGIVQTWRPTEDKWPRDHFSEITFELSQVAGGKCKINFTHKNVPAEIADTFKQGWKDYYWEPMKEFFNS